MTFVKLEGRTSLQNFLGFDMTLYFITLAVLFDALLFACFVLLDRVLLDRVLLDCGCAGYKGGWANL